MSKTYPTLSRLVTTMALSVLSTAMTAQVYQTTDKDGNPVFSDTPSAGASEVEIQAPNTAESVEVRPRPSQPKQAEPAKSSAATPAQPEQTERLDPYLIHSDRDDRRRLDKPEHRPENRPKRPSNQPARITRPANPR